MPSRWIRTRHGRRRCLAGAPFRDTMDLRQGYVELGDIEKQNVGFRFGRQELDFGEGRILGLSPWANTARSFDGFRTSYAGRWLSG